MLPRLRRCADLHCARRRRRCWPRRRPPSRIVQRRETLSPAFRARRADSVDTTSTPIRAAVSEPWSAAWTEVERSPRLIGAEYVGLTMAPEKQAMAAGLQRKAQATPDDEAGRTAMEIFTENFPVSSTNSRE